ncbi:MAG: dihydropteroate synthase [Anaerolineae bacterium]|nr:dihydropteroate synthase [Anaerolineae bacterium]
MDEPALRVLQLSTPQAIRAELERVGADSSVSSAARAEQLARAGFYHLKLERVSLVLARLLYQELVMEGGQVVTAPRLDHAGAGETDVLLSATRYQFNHLLVRLRLQSSDELATLADEMQRALDNFDAMPSPLRLGPTTLDWSRTYVMGILNITPDSFSGDALIQPGEPQAQTVARVLERAHQLVLEGADILDLGAESTRPGATPVPIEIELERVLPVLRALCAEIGVPLSIDTSKAVVADAALNAGAAMVNDVRGLGDADMKRVAAGRGAPVVVMHNWMEGRRPAEVSDVVGVILGELRTQIEAALDVGIRAENLLIDPGLGFGKTPAENLEILDRLGELRAPGLPIVIGPSRKGFISKAIGVPADEREQGTAAAISVGILRGAHVVRVHDVKTMSRIARMTDAIVR